MTASATSTLAGFLHSLRLSDIPSSILETVRHCILDYFAAAWNSQNHPLAATYSRIALDAGGKGPFPLVGGAKTSAMYAAFGNAALAHITEVDDLHRLSTMHPGICVIPVSLVLARELELSGAAFVQSVVCGYEAAIRVGAALGREHYALFHTTGTAGTFGAAAAAAKAMNLDAEAFTHALGHAGTQAAGLWQFLEDGAPQAKALHPAKAAQNGLLAARLAAAGIPAAYRILEGNKGLFSFATSAGDLTWLTRHLGSPLMVEEVCFKSYPACGQIISMLDAVRDLVHEHGIRAEDVEDVQADVYRQVLSIAANPAPTNLEEAKFSCQTCIAFTLVYGDLTFRNFTAEAALAPQVRELAARVRPVFDPEMDARFPQMRPCRVTIRTRSGETFSRENMYRSGDPEKPLDRDQHAAKLHQLTDHVLDDTKRNRLIDWCWTLPEHPPQDFLFVA